MAIELTTATTATLSGIRQSLGLLDLRNFLPELKVSFRASAVGPNQFSQFTISDTGSKLVFSSITGPLISILDAAYNTFIGYPVTTKLSSIEGGQYLTSLIADRGTSYTILLTNQGLSAEQLNQFFTDLPANHPTPLTIVVTGNPGAATCNTGIATAKNYTVTT